MVTIAAALLFSATGAATGSAQAPLHIVTTELEGEVRVSTVSSGVLAYQRRDPETSVFEVRILRRQVDERFTLEQTLPEIDSAVGFLALVGGKLIVPTGSTWRVYSRVDGSWQQTQFLPSMPWWSPDAVVDGETLVTWDSNEVVALRVGATVVVDRVLESTAVSEAAIHRGVLGVTSPGAHLRVFRFDGTTWVAEHDGPPPEPPGHLEWAGFDSAALSVRDNVIHYVTEFGTDGPTWGLGDPAPITFLYDAATSSWEYQLGCIETVPSAFYEPHECNISQDCIEGRCSSRYQWSNAVTVRGDVALGRQSPPFVADWTGSTWSARGSLPVAATHSFGSNVAIDDTAAVVNGVAYSFCGVGGCERGDACGSNSDCVTGACTDGFCCERACRGTCKACDVPGSEGLCTPISGLPHGDRYGCLSCDAGVCIDDSLFPNGFSCAVDAACASGSCVDGVCCDRACGDACEACNESGAEGTCSPVTGAPRGDREGCLTCGAGTCVDGASCATSGDCAGNPCVDGVCCEAECGACDSCNVPGSVGLCTPISGEPRTRGEGCAFCDDGTCRPALRGEACSGSEQCADGDPCVDGYCCERLCAGDCKACDVAGSLGECVAVSGPAHGDRDCATCDDGACLDPSDGADLGAICGVDDECASGECVDGRCCERACGNPCSRCDQLGNEGMCLPFSGPPVADAAGCGACVDGSCVLVATGQACTRDDACASGACADGVCCDDTCDGACERCDQAGSIGTCEQVTGEPRAGASCSECDAGTCVAGLPIGYSCDDAAQCETGHCADGVCCDRNCEGACESCRVSRSDPDRILKGICRPAYDTGDDCSYCGIAGDCRYGNTCESDLGCALGHCVDGFCCDEACDGLCEACDVVGSEGECTPFTGVPVSGTSPACEACEAGRCVNAIEGPLGAPCTRGGQCESRKCVDGVCCNNGCGLACSACDVPGSEGTCSPITGLPTMSSDRCARCVDGVCDDVTLENGDACRFPSDCPSRNCVDGVCCDSVCEDDCSRCDLPDSLGVCSPVTGEPREGARCATCDDGTCIAGLTLGASCTADENCYSGFCVDGACCNRACEGACESCQGRYYQTAGLSSFYLSAGICTPIDGLTPRDGCTECDEGRCTDAGETCDEASDCSGGNCVDGVCCVERCAGVCKSCAEPGSEGACIEISGDARGERDCDECAAGTCMDGRTGAGLGAACVVNGDCQSRQCIGGLCCDTACDGECEACDLAGSDGICGACDTCDAGVCGGEGPKALGDECVDDEACDSGHCVDGVCCERACRGACKACGESGSEGSCVPISGAPRGDRDGCLSCHDGICAASGAGSLGEVCADNDECTSGQCVDGVCCERACRGTCKACNVAGMEGQCEPISGDPVGAREGCTTCMTGVCIEASALDGTCVGTFAECEASINARIAGGELERDVLEEHRRIEREVMLDRADIAGREVGALCAASHGEGNVIWCALFVALAWRLRRRG